MRVASTASLTVFSGRVFTVWLWGHPKTPDDEKLLKKKTQKIELLHLFSGTLDLRYKNLHHDCPTSMHRKVIKHAIMVIF